MNCGAQLTKRQEQHGGSQVPCAEQKQPGSEGYMQCDSMCVTSWKTVGTENWPVIMEAGAGTDHKGFWG